MNLRTIAWGLSVWMICFCLNAQIPPPNLTPTPPADPAAASNPSSTTEPPPDFNPAVTPSSQSGTPDSSKQPDDSKPAVTPSSPSGAPDSSKQRVDSKPTVTPSTPDETPDSGKQRVDSKPTPTLSTSAGTPDAETNPIPSPKPDELPVYLKQVQIMLNQHDLHMAISYLRSMVPSGILSDADRSRAIIELADSLVETGQDAEALVWLKTWIEQYPGRPEAGGIDFRIGCLYQRIHMYNLSRDAFYLALAATINHGSIKNPSDLHEYSLLSTDILWKLSEIEFQCGDFARADKLMGRYLLEADGASATSKERAEFIRADCSYQLHSLEEAKKRYEQCLSKYPFNPLALDARLRLYHVCILLKQTDEAREDLDALIWTVQTVWPNQESTWRKRVAEMLLAVHSNDPTLQQPMITALGKIVEKKDEELAHYVRIRSLQFDAIPTQSIPEVTDQTQIVRLKQDDQDLDKLSKTLDQILSQGKQQQ